MDNISNDIDVTISKVTALEPIESIWRPLEERCQPSFFLSWTWIGPWARNIVKQTDLYLYHTKKRDKTVALCFFTVCEVRRLNGLLSSKQVQINEYLSNKNNMVIQYNGLLAEENNQAFAWDSLVEGLLKSNIRWDELAVSSVKYKTMCHAKKAANKLTHKVDKEHFTWRVELSHECGNVESLLTKFKNKSRQQLRQSIKAFKAEYGDISFHVATSVDEALDYFKKMEAFHTSRWNEVGKSGSFANEKWVSFHRGIITTGFPRDQVLLMEVRSGDLVLGYLYGHLYNDTAYMQQTGFLVTQDNRLRPGYMSHLQAMIFSAKNSIKYYDFLPDDENSYKKFFTEPGDAVYWVRFQRHRIKFFVEELARKMLARS